MQQQGKIQSVRWITLFLGLICLSACGKPPSDETRLRQALANIEKAAEAKTVRPLLDYLAEDFQGNGVYSKANIRGLLLIYFRQNPHIHVYMHISELIIQGTQANIRCEVIVAGRGEKIVPERGHILEIDTNWQKRDGQWQVVRASWKDTFR